MKGKSRTRGSSTCAALIQRQGPPRPRTSSAEASLWSNQSGNTVGEVRRALTDVAKDARRCTLRTGMVLHDLTPMRPGPDTRRCDARRVTGQRETRARRGSARPEWVQQRSCITINSSDGRRLSLNRLVVLLPTPAAVLSSEAVEGLLPPATRRARGRAHLRGRPCEGVLGGVRSTDRRAYGGDRPEGGSRMATARSSGWEASCDEIPNSEARAPAGAHRARERVLRR
jgi:hypothetical protein